MANNYRPGIISDGSTDWSGGVNSMKCTTIKSEQNPNGLGRNELSWLINATVRDGGITPKTGWNTILGIAGSSGYWQGGIFYEPIYAYPYLICVVSGHVLKVDIMTTAIQDLSVTFNLYITGNYLCHFCQAEKYLIIQSGDYGKGGAVVPGVTDAQGNMLPLFWDDVTLRRSVGITNTAVATGTNGVNEIPAATVMKYYMLRLWYAQGRRYSAGDIVKGASGTPANNYDDAILNVTENPMVLGGDGFAVPAHAGNIRALEYSANLDTALGQGQLFVFTSKQVFSLEVPPTRLDWIAADKDNQPKQRVVQLTNGAVNDKSIVAINGDLFYQCLEPSIRSLFMAVRDFTQWANIPISRNIERLLRYNDRSLLYGANGVVYDNRLLQTALPIIKPQGIVHQALSVLDFAPVSSLSEQMPPVWEGVWEGLDILQCFTADFGGYERMFAAIVSRVDGSIQLWEQTDSQRFTNDDMRTTWNIEFPAFTWGNVFRMKRLLAGEVWADKILGEVIFEMFYRPDGDVCWHKWHKWKVCSARNSCDDIDNPICYPLTEYRESFRSTMGLPLPPNECQSVSGRPVNVAFQIQPRLQIKGWARVRGIIVHGEWFDEPLYAQVIC